MSNQVLSTKAPHRTEADRLLYSMVLCFVLLLLCFAWVSHLLGSKELTFLLGVAAIWLCVRRPEISFALFLNAGMFKGDPRLAGVEGYVDLTVLFLLASFAGILRGIWKKEIQLLRPPKRLVLPFVALLVLASVSFVHTPAPLYGREKLLRFLTLTTFAFAGPWFLFQKESRLNAFFAAFATVSTALALQVLFGGILEPGETAFQEAFGSGYLGLGSVCAQGTLIGFLYFFLRTKTFGARLFWGALSLLNTFGALVSGARGSAIALGIMSLVTLFRSSWLIRQVGKAHKTNGMTARRTIAGLLTFLGATAAILVALKSYFYTLFVRMDLLLNYLDVQQAGRLDYYHTAIAFILSFPKGLLGLGIGGWTIYYEGFDAPRGGFPHNVLLEVGVEMGWLGLAALVWLFLGAVRTGVALQRRAVGQQSLEVFCLFALLLYMFLFSLIHGDINDLRNWFTWMCAIYAYRQFLVQIGPKTNGFPQKGCIPNNRPSLSF